MKILVAILMALFFVGCVNPTVNNMSKVRLAAFDVGENKIPLNKETYSDFYHKVNSLSWKHVYQFTKTSTYPFFYLELELLKSAQLSIQNNKITRTQKFQSYLDDIKNLYPENFINYWREENMRDILKDDLKKSDEKLKNIFSDSEYFEYMKNDVTINNEKKYYIQLKRVTQKIKKSQIKDKIKFYEDAIKKLDILFTKNYKGDFSIN